MSLIIFDMDGTLVNSGYAIANTINHVRKNIGFETLDKDYILENVNDPDVNSSKFFFGTDTFTKEHSSIFEKYYDKHCLSDLVVYDGIEKLINDLNKDFTLAVATNAHSNYALKMLEYVGLHSCFDTILGYDNVKNSKPHPEMINKILNKHSIHKQNTQVIGDSRKDALAAKGAGVDFVLVNWGFSNHKNEGIENIQELEKKIFDKFNKKG